MKFTFSKLFPSLMLAAMLLSACATSQPSATTVTLLGSAGFKLHMPKTAKQKEIFASLPSYKIESVMVNGHKYYVYKDGEKNLALVGHEAEYERYRQLAKDERQSAGHQNMMIASEADTSMWQGASGSDWW